MSSKTAEYFVMKNKDGYLEDVWEEWEEDINYSFTDDLSSAVVFRKYELDCEYGAPKYLWDDKNEKNIRTIDEMCKFFKGEMVKVRKSILWNEI